MKVSTIIQRVLTVVMAVVAVCMMVFTVVSVATFDRSDRDLFGYKAYIALSDSMKATDFEAGDLLLVKETDCSTLQVGDIIAYTSKNSSNYGETVTHKIRELATTASGEPGFVTYGTTTGTDDETVVGYGDVLGKYEGRLPGVGRFFQFLKTTPGYILCIFLPFLVLILLEGARSVRLFRQYKSEQMEELRAEREAAEAERLEAQRMMHELAQMREQMVRAGPVQQPVEYQPAVYEPQQAVPVPPMASTPAYVPRTSGGRARHFKQGTNTGDRD